MGVSFTLFKAFLLVLRQSKKIGLKGQVNKSEIRYQ